MRGWWGGVGACWLALAAGLFGGRDAALAAAEGCRAVAGPQECFVLGTLHGRQFQANFGGVWAGLREDGPEMWRAVREVWLEAGR